MLDAETPEADAFAALHQKKKRFLFALFGNVVLLVVMVGGPFVRGYLRTRELWREFGRFGACLTGGTPSAEPGMGMPTVTEAYFAARLLERPGGWPGHCQTILKELTPDEPIFLLPNLKRAENDIRAAAALVQGELTAVTVRVPGERLSRRPLRALEHLRAAITRHSLATGVLEVPDGDAFSLGAAKGLPLPVRLPLFASSDARIRVWGDGAQLYAVAVDVTGVSYLRVGAGGLDQKRQPRPKLLEGFLPTSQGGLFVWAMPPARCREREGGCAQKTMGVGLLAAPLVDPPKPLWLGAHPAGRIDRTVHEMGGQLWVLAEGKERTRVLRSFALPEPLLPSAEEAMPLAATTQGQPQTAADGVLLVRAGQPAALTVQASGEALSLQLAGQDQPPAAIAHMSAGQEPWVTTTPCRDGLAVAFGHQRALTLGFLGADGRFSHASELALPLTGVIDDRDSAHDRVRAACVQEGSALALVRDMREQLLTVTCASQGLCSSHVIANQVFSFTNLPLSDGDQLLAFAGSRNLAQLRVMAVDAHGKVRRAAQVPSACWAPTGGMCGSALLERVGNRVLLGAREGTDLMMLESNDDGRSWQALRGLKRE